MDIDINKPLRCGVKIVVKSKAIWIDLGYVKLPDFCPRCGRVGHTITGRDMVDGDVDESELQYGEWLRAFPIKSKRRNAKVEKQEEKQEEKKLFMAFRMNKDASKAKTRLLFLREDYSTTPPVKAVMGGTEDT